MKKAIVLTNIKKDPSLLWTSRVIDKLSYSGILVYLDRGCAGSVDSCVTYYDEYPNDADLIVVIGGDGSVIDASRVALDLDIPILGINLGKVGYLATVDPENLDVLSLIESGEYTVDERMVLSTEKLSSDGIVTTSDRLAVNDVVICHDSYLGISDIKLDNDKGDQVQYRADGIIVSTPVGSTAYALSAGGPVITHNLEAISVTPICPHSFFNRSIVYSPDERIRVSNMGDSPLNISIDGRLFDTLSKDESCVVYKSDFRIKMIRFEDQNIFSTLTKKIKLLHELV